MRNRDDLTGEIERIGAAIRGWAMYWFSRGAGWRHVDRRLRGRGTALEIVIRRAIVPLQRTLDSPNRQRSTAEMFTESACGSRESNI
jgi:hypothetical protein